MEKTRSIAIKLPENKITKIKKIDPTGQDKISLGLRFIIDSYFKSEKAEKIKVEKKPIAVVQKSLTPGVKKKGKPVQKSLFPA